MLLAILFIVLIVIGIICAHIYNNNWDDYVEWLLYIFVPALIIGIVGLIISVSIILAKPIDYKHFKINYTIISEQITASDDVRDATYTLQINDINKQIITCREFINSKWVGIYYNKKICDYELIKKEN